MSSGQPYGVMGGDPVAEKLAGALALAPPVVTPSPIVQGDFRERIMSPGHGRLLNDFAKELGEKLAKTRKIFRRNGRAVVVDEDKRELIEISDVEFITWLENAEGGNIVCHGFAGRGDAARLIDCTMSKSCAEAVLVSRAFLSALPRIRRVNRVRLPVWNWYDPRASRRPRKPSSDVIVLLPAGYDAEEETFTFDDVPFDADLNIYYALEILEKWLRDVALEPIDRERSLAVVFAMLLTPFCDLLLSDKAQKPAFMVIGNCEGCGKTLLVKLALAPVFGPVAVTTYPGREKLTETLAAVARDGRPYFFLDNLKGESSEPALAALEPFLSAARVSGRTLGLKDTYDVEKRCLVYLTGNNVTVSPDMRRRLLFANLFVEDARPELRPVTRRIEETDILHGRAEILAALWSIVRYWCYDAQFHPGDENASFWQWGRTIGGIVQSVLRDQSPLAAPKSERDQRLVTWESFMRILARDLQDEAQFTPGELREAARESALFSFLADNGETLDSKEHMEEASIFGRRFCEHFLGRCFDVPGGHVWFRDNGELGRARRYILSRNRATVTQRP